MINSQLCRERAGHSRHFSAQSAWRVPGAGEGQARGSLSKPSAATADEIQINCKET